MKYLVVATIPETGRQFTWRFDVESDEIAKRIVAQMNTPGEIQKLYKEVK